MASTMIQCLPHLGMGCEREIGGTAIAQKCSSCATPVANLHCGFRFGSGRTFTSGGGRRGGEKPVAALRFVQRSSPFAGFVESLQESEGSMLRRSNSRMGNCRRAQLVGAKYANGSSTVNRDLLANVEIGSSSINGVNGHLPVNGLKKISPVRCLNGNSPLRGVNGKSSMNGIYGKSPMNGVIRKFLVNADGNAHVCEKFPVNVEMLEPYEVEDKVRDYELDHFGVVNNAVYVQYCQQARHELLENIGFTPNSVTDSGQSMAYSEFTIKFHAPLRSGDRYVVSARIAGTTAARLRFEDFVYKLPERKLIVSTNATAVFLNEKYERTRIPDDVRAKLLKYKVRSCPSLSDLNGNSASNNTHINGNSTVDQSHVNGNGKLAANDPLLNGNSATKHPQLNGCNLSDLNGNSANVSHLIATQPPTTLLSGDRSS